MEENEVVKISSIFYHDSQGLLCSSVHDVEENPSSASYVALETDPKLAYAVIYTELKNSKGQIVYRKEENIVTRKELNDAKARGEIRFMYGVRPSAEIAKSLEELGRQGAE